MDFIDGFRTTRHGRIHYLEKGEGEPLLLLHSNGCSGYEFEPAMAELSGQFRCIAWDMPGHGDSDQPPRHQSVGDYADAVLAFMDSMELETAHVCGASIGGIVCIELGALAPQRIRSLVIAEAALRSRQEWATQWPRIEAMFAIPAQSKEQVAPRFRALTEGLLARWNIDRHKTGGWRMVDVMWAIREYDALAALGRITCPVSVLVGDKGPVFSSVAKYRELVPNAPIMILPDTGHFPMIDDPIAFARAVHEATRLSSLSK